MCRRSGTVYIDPDLRVPARFGAGFAPMEKSALFLFHHESIEWLALLPDFPSVLPQMLDGRNSQPFLGESRSQTKPNITMRLLAFANLQLHRPLGRLTAGS